MLTINLSLDNTELYKGCTVIMVAGRNNLETNPNEATNIIGINLQSIIINNKKNHDEVTLTGAMAVWAYLVVFHVVVHQFRKIWYDDGKGNKILIAAHG